METVIILKLGNKKKNGFFEGEKSFWGSAPLRPILGEGVRGMRVKNAFNKYIYILWLNFTLVIIL